MPSPGSVPIYVGPEWTTGAIGITPLASWSQATWFWDPANVSGLANDTNTGLDALHPVLTYNGGIAAKWGTYSPQLRQQTTITMMSSQAAVATDPVILDPIMYGTYMLLQGQLGPHQQVTAGVFGAVTSKNTATGQLLEVNLGFVATKGQLVQNTTHPSFAIVMSVVGDVATMFQPLTAVTPPASTFTTFPTEVNTWAPGDAFTLWQPCTVYLAEAVPRTGQEDAADVLPCQVQLYHVTPIGPNADPGENSALIGNGVANIECYYGTFATTTPAAPVTGNVQNWGTVYGAGIEWSNDDPHAVFNGGGVTVEFFSTIRCQELALGVAFVSTSPQFVFHSTFMHWEEVCLSGTSAGEFGLLGNHEMFDAASLIWGSGGLLLFGTSAVYYHAGSAATTFLQAQGFSLNQSANAMAVDPTTGLWSASIPVTVAALDTTIALGGFGGHAIQPGGASISVFPPF